MATFPVSSEADVVEVVRGARDSRRTLEIACHGTKRGYGRPVECDDVLDLSGLTGIVNYEPDEMIITARAGTPVADIEAALAEHNQRLGFEPADWGALFGAPANAATIGGVISANCDGSAAVRYGRCRDHLLGFRAVNGFGEAYKGGGKVVKNVTGFDLPKLFCGAMGTLGPLTEVTLRVFPKSPLTIVFEIQRLTFPQAISLLHRAWSSALQATCLAYVPAVAARQLPGLGENSVLIRLEGSYAHQDEQHAILRELMTDHDIAENEDGNAIIGGLGEGMPFQCNLLGIWRITIPSSEAAAFIEELSPATWFADRAGALLWVGVKRSTGRIHELATKFGGFAVQVRNDVEMPSSVMPFPPESPIRTALTQRVKAAFDPLKLFNPGRMWEGV